MNIGIIGYGKMGKDIFSLFFDKLPDAEFTVLEIADAEKNTAAVVKTLDKSLKRKKITQEQYDLKKSSFRFTDNVNDLKDCDLVIEAIFENIQAKQDIARGTNSLGFPVIVIGSRVKIPKLPFIRFMREGIIDNDIE